MLTITPKSDLDIKTDVLSELKYEPSVHITDIGVLVKDGAVTLNGNATTYSEKWNAVKAAKRVAGVRAVADDIEIKLSGSQKRDDGDVAIAAANHIDWLSWTLPGKTVQVTVRDGWITLEGQVEWWYQKDSAESAVRHLSGVKGVSNQITIKPKLSATSVEHEIEAAFQRNAILDAEKINVIASGNKVTLSGKVRSYAERDEAERVAWAAPGVYSVDNQLAVQWSWFGE